MTKENVIERTKEFKPNDTVKSCELLEKGIRFWNKGIVCCSAVTIQSPILVSAEEMRSGKVTYELIVQRRRELFEGINGLREMDLAGCAKCALIKEKLYKDVSFDYIGGLGGSCLASSFNISHFSACNMRCKYCDYTIRNDFVPPQYDNIIEIIEEYRKRGRLLAPNSIDYNGGEPTLLKNFDEILDYLVGKQIGYVTVYSNCLKYSDSIYKALKDNKIGVITSLDAGTAESFKKIHGVDAFQKVIETIIRYQKSGTKNLVVKYNICEDNVTEEDLWGFVFAMIAIKPSHVFICPEFPYGDMVIPEKTVEFGARMYYMLKKYAGVTCYIQTDDMKGDPKLVKYSSDIREHIDKILEKDTFCNEYNINITEGLFDYECSKQENQRYGIKKLKFLKHILSIKNEGAHKVFRILGIKIKMKRKVKKG